MEVTPIVQLQRDHAQRIFDALVSSLDFGSGFLGDEDVEALRALAVLLGVNPMLGTPREFASSYAHSVLRIDGTTAHGHKHDPATCWDCR